MFLLKEKMYKHSWIQKTKSVAIEPCELFLTIFFLYLHSYPWVGCLANDTVSGQTSISEFKRVNVLNINR